jgi:chromosome partitioning protein
VTVIAVLSQKGGSGKTTIATNLAVAIQAAGRSVTILDTDPQGSSMDWGAMRARHAPDKIIPVINLPKPTERDLRMPHIVPPAEFYVLDGEPQVSERMISALKLADLVLIPVQPSPFDQWASVETVELVRMRMAVSARMQAALVISRAMTGTELARDIPDQLGQFDLPVLGTVIHGRTAYPTSAVSGSGAVEGKDLLAAGEINSLLDEVLALVGKDE